jgi:hypothetical protein
LSLAVHLPLLGRARDLHPLDYAHVGRTIVKGSVRLNRSFFCAYMRLSNVFRVKTSHNVPMPISNSF